jgi:hypothetical protein
MIYRFLILSDEVSDFVREIKIDSEATFLDLHKAIIKSTAYAADQMCSFFICDDDWGRRTEVTLIDMGKKSFEEDNYIMENTPLEALLEDEDEKLIYVFDYMTERSFFIELREIIPGKTLSQPLCSRSEGLPPPQMINFDEIADTAQANNSLPGEYLYGDSEYDIEELDNEGFDGLENIENPFGEERF